MATTSPDNIWTPDATDDYALTADLATTASTVQAAIASVRNPSDRNQQFYGPTASMGSVTGMKRGDTYQESDGAFRLWHYNGSGWVGGGASITFTGIYSSSVAAPVSLNVSGSRVYMEGVVASTTATFNAGTTYAVAAAGGVPAALRPPVDRSVACSANLTALATVIVRSTGAIDMVLNSTFTGTLALDLTGANWKIA